MSTTKIIPSLSYYRGCRIKEVPFSSPKQYETLGKVWDSYEAAKKAIDKSFIKLQNSIVK